MNKLKKCLKCATFIMIIIFILIESFLILKKEFQNDTFYSIKIGEYLTQNGINSLKTDVFSWHENLRYCNPHWLNDILIYFSFSLGNFLGVYILTYIEVVILGILIFYISYKESKNKWISVIFTLISIYLLQSFLAARAQLISYIIFILEVFFIRKYIEKPKKRYAIFLFILALILANTHSAVFPIYLVLFLPFIVEGIIAKILKKDKVIFNKIVINQNNNFKKLLIVFLIVSLIGLINPFGPTSYTYILKSVLGTTMDYLNEHKPVTFEYLWENKPYIIAYLASLFILICPKQKVKLCDIFLSIGLIILSILGVRQLAIFIVVSSSFWAKYTEEIKNNFLKLKIFKGEKFLILRSLGTIFIIFTIFLMSFKYYQVYKDKDFVEEDSYPVKASKWIKENLNLKNLRIYNNYTDGSYLVFAGIPNFIDTRCDLFTAEFNSSLKKNEDIFSGSMKVQENPSKYKEIFEKYDINAALVNKNSFYLYDIGFDEEFKNVYEDENYIVYIKGDFR